MLLHPLSWTFRKPTRCEKKLEEVIDDLETIADKYVDDLFGHGVERHMKARRIPLPACVSGKCMQCAAYCGYTGVLPPPKDFVEF